MQRVLLECRLGSIEVDFFSVLCDICHTFWCVDGGSFDSSESIRAVEIISGLEGTI